MEALSVVSIRIGTRLPESHEWVVLKAPIAPTKTGVVGEPISKRVPVPGRVLTENYVLFAVDADDASPLGDVLRTVTGVLLGLYQAYGETRPDDFELVLWISMDNNRKSVEFPPELIDVLARLGGAIQLLIED